MLSEKIIEGYGVISITHAASTTDKNSKYYYTTGIEEIWFDEKPKEHSGRDKNFKHTTITKKYFYNKDFQNFVKKNFSDLRKVLLGETGHHNGKVNLKLIEAGMLTSMDEKVKQILAINEGVGIKTFNGFEWFDLIPSNLLKYWLNGILIRDNSCIVILEKNGYIRGRDGLFLKKIA